MEWFSSANASLLWNPKTLMVDNSRIAHATILWIDIQDRV